MAAITQLAQLDPNGRYTYADYLTWKFEEFVELIEGRMRRQVASPGSRHQQYSTNLVAEIGRFLKGVVAVAELLTHSCLLLPSWL